MRSFFSFLLILTLAGSSFGQYCPPGQQCPPSSWVQPSPRAVAPDANESNLGVGKTVVQVVMQSGNGGSGTRVYESSLSIKLVYTAYHVTGPVDSVGKVIFYDGKSYRATVIATEPQNDIAVLAFNGPDDLPGTKLGDDSPGTGETLVKIGYPADLSSPGHPSIRWGRCRSCLGELQTNIPVYSGDSGGGVFATNGGLVGVVTGYRDYDHSHQYGPGLPLLKRFHNLICLPRCRNYNKPNAPITIPPKEEGNVPDIKPETPIAKPSELNNKEVIDQLKKLQEQIGNIKPVPGPKGDQGERGPTGPQGPIGPKGDVDPAIKQELDRLNKLVDQQSKDIEKLKTQVGEQRVLVVPVVPNK